MTSFNGVLYIPQFIVALAIAAQGALAAAPSAAIPEATRACTREESWSDQHPYGKFLRANLGKSLGNPEKAATTLLQITEGRRKLKGAPATQDSNRFLMDYLHYRLLYDFKLTRLAYNGFNELAAAPVAPALLGVQSAVLACLNAIHSEYATLGLTPAAFSGVSRLLSAPALPPASRETAREAVAARAAYRIARGEPLEGELTLLSGAGPWVAYVKMLEAATRGSEAEIIAQAPALADNKLPAALALKRDSIHLAMGRAYYGLKQYDRAIEELKRVSNKSNLFVESLGALGWAQLMKSDTTDSIGTTSNLLAGTLRHAFAPEAYDLMAIALNETCHNPEALQISPAFKKSYAATWDWLSTWTKNGQPTSGLYVALTEGLKKKRRIPEPILTDWVRSPAFQAAQAELNTTVDDKDATKLLWGVLRKFTTEKENRRWIGAQNDLSKLLLAPIQLGPSWQANLIKQIESELADRNRRMIEEIRTATANLQLVQVEIYSALGDQIMASARENDGSNRKKKDDGGEHGQAPGPTWDWGRYREEESGKSEIWEDELGGIRSDIGDNCRD